MSVRGKTIGALSIAAILVVVGRFSLGATKPPSVELDLTVDEHFAFSPATLRCPSGTPVRLRIRHRLPASGPDFPHTTVLLKSGVNLDAFGNAAVEAQAENNYVPASFRDQVIATSPIVHSGEQTELVFQSPAQPGPYPIVCSFPGHCLLGMRAVLNVQ